MDIILFEKLIDIAITIFIASTIGFVCWRIGFIKGFRAGEKYTLEKSDSSN